jgi:hypothetical protein
MKHLPIAPEIHIVYYPQLGCQIVIPRSPHLDLSHQPKYPGIHPWVLLTIDLEFQFATEVNLYFKNARMRELDAFLGDIHNDIVDMEASITRSLEIRILECGDMLNIVTNVVAEVDWYENFLRIFLELALLVLR